MRYKKLNTDRETSSMVSQSSLSQTSQSGFTLIELLVVIAILGVLAALIAGLAGSSQLAARTRSTEALIDRLGLSCKTYKVSMGFYPPDGYESKVRTSDGTPVFSSAALYLALSKDQMSKKLSPTGKLVPNMMIEAIESFGDGMLSKRDSSDKNLRDIVDSFNNPIHYDNTVKFSVQSEASSHPSIEEEELDFHPEDIRQTEYVVRPGIQNKKMFDLWSHGYGSTNSDDYRGENTIANFKILLGESRSEDEDDGG